MKYGIRRMAALFALLGITSTIGAISSGNDYYNSIMLFAWSVAVMVATGIRD